ncbi:hypothetical protein PDIG_85760 [Penicillium digitatum PHI26]|uniref:Uncharacterized protein n=2 Tax=Penicillium digitatum TaxID=36651 RepID=K9F7D9_PEND2|nr:hypothetical protein PDIP_47310 [Penicillium digitatum Pd1]EKV05009.1 hypothetical protein PDIG_85760 [Penicillium digitatum PHI26]EKV13778.1 hypothetical protein PDIP_47310 [Penicillium digitatum Pd1]
MKSESSTHEYYQIKPSFQLNYLILMMVSTARSFSCRRSTNRAATSQT